MDLAASLLGALAALSAAAALLPVLAFFVPLFLSYRTPASRRARQLVGPMPGPPTLPVLGNALEFVISREKMVELLDQFTSKYFPIYRVWSFNSPVINPIGPEYVEAILHSSKNIEKSLIYNLLHPWLGSGLLTSKGEKWFSHRKFLTPAFHFKILEKFIPVFKEKSESLLEQLSVEAAAGKAFNVVPYISQYTLEVICESAMGIKLDKKDNRQLQYFSAVYTLGSIVYYRAVRPWLFMDWIFALTPSAFKQRRCLKILHDFTDKVISEKKREYILNRKKEKSADAEPKKKKVRAFLDLLVELALEDNLLTDVEIREEVDTFMFEGHDTTSMAICWTLFCLANNPDIQERVWEEVAALPGEEDSPEGSAASKEYGEMKLLEMCIKESLRIYPSVPFIARVLTEDLQMGEYLIPANTMVHIHIRNIHQNPVIYPQPERFDPDRFLPEAVRSRHPYAYVPFSAGPRNCIGQRFAMLEMKSVIVAIIRRFRVIAVDTPEGVRLISDLVLRSSDGLRVRLEHRQ